MHRGVTQEQDGSVLQACLGTHRIIQRTCTDLSHIAFPIHVPEICEHSPSAHIWLTAGGCGIPSDDGAGVGCKTCCWGISAPGVTHQIASTKLRLPLWQMQGLVQGRVVLSCGGGDGHCEGLEIGSGLDSGEGGLPDSHTCMHIYMHCSRPSYTTT